MDLATQNNTNLFSYSSVGLTSHRSPWANVRVSAGLRSFLEALEEDRSHSSSGNFFPTFPLLITNLPFSILEKHSLTLFPSWDISPLFINRSCWQSQCTFHVPISSALSPFSVHPTSAIFLPEDNTNLLFAISIGHFSVVTIFNLSAVDDIVFLSFILETPALASGSHSALFCFCALDFLLSFHVNNSPGFHPSPSALSHYRHFLWGISSTPSKAYILIAISSISPIDQEWLNIDSFLWFTLKFYCFENMFGYLRFTFPGNLWDLREVIEHKLVS